MALANVVGQLQNLIAQQNSAAQNSAAKKEGLIRQTFETQRGLVGEQTQDAARRALSRRGIDINTPHGQRMLSEMQGSRYDALAAQEAQQLANLPEGNGLQAQIQALGMMADMARAQQAMDLERERFKWQQQQTAQDRAAQAAAAGPRRRIPIPQGGGGGGRRGGATVGGGGGRPIGATIHGDPQIRSPLESIFADEVRHNDARREHYLNNLPGYGEFQTGNPRAHNVLSADNPYNNTLYSGQPANSMVTGGKQPGYLQSPVAMTPSTVGAMDGFTQMNQHPSLYQPGPSSTMTGASSVGWA